MESKKTNGASCVRFSDPERRQIEEATRATGNSIPWLLKNAFFSYGPIRPVFDRTSAAELRMELNRIGININQIAREINSGLKKGWHQEFQECNRLLERITNSLGMKIANR